MVTVSGIVPPDLRASIEAGRRPRVDYVEIADALDALLLDRPASRRELGRFGMLVERLAGADVAMALALFRRRRWHGAVFSDGEQVGLPYAALCLVARRRPRHVMIGHRLSPRKKVWLHRLLRLQRRVDMVLVYAETQRRVAVEELGYPPDRVVLHPFMVDTGFWRPDSVDIRPRRRPLICAVGQELRDYPTLVAAVRGIDVDVVVAAASPWSKREDTSSGLEIPPNVTVEALDQYELRQLYADADLVVVPLQETDFQAGITTILEAMSMARAVVCTRTAGQTDTIIEGETGLYVDVGDVDGLKAAIVSLLGDPDARAHLAINGQRWVRMHADVEMYAHDIASLVSATSS